MASSAEAEVLHEFRGAVRAAVLNRPRALNALSLPMIEQLHGVYAAWDAAPGVAAILLKGAGGKAFCAGGDVKAVALAGRAGDAAGALRFFRAEYRLNYLIARLSKPHVALLDGITMGGGAGVSVHGAFRVATERTLFAMPECAIGLFPDVGGSYFLPRLPGGLGLYLGLTGARLRVRVDAVWMAAFAQTGVALPWDAHCIGSIRGCREWTCCTPAWPPTSSPRPCCQTWRRRSPRWGRPPPTRPPCAARSTSSRAGRRCRRGSCGAAWPT